MTALLANRPAAIARYDLATGTLQPLVEGAIRPALSPDGQRLAFIRQPVMPDAPYAALAVAGADGAGARALTGPETRLAGTAAPRWSPDNRRIIFAGAAPPPEDATPPAARPPTDGSLWLIDADGQGLRRLTDADLVAPRVAWNPDDSNVIAYTGGIGVMVRDLTTGQERRLAERGTYSNGIAWGTGGKP